MGQKEPPNLEDLGVAIEHFFILYSAGETKRTDVDQQLEEKCSRVIDIKHLEPLLLLITEARRAQKADDQISVLGILGRIVAKIRSSLEDWSASLLIEAEAKANMKLFYRNK
jgi:hypothetical protein